MAAYVAITNYGDQVLTVCPTCGQQMSHGTDDRAAALEAAEHNARHAAAA
jgi:Fe-S oxidoreductase